MSQERGARSVKEFCEWAGIGTTMFYDQVKRGKLKVRKVGSKTVVLDEDGRAWLDSLPEETCSRGRREAAPSAAA